MDFIKKILESFLNKKDKEIFSFIHNMEKDSEERVITVHSNSDGFITFCIFTPEQWSMIIDICQLTNVDVEEVILQIAEDENIATITVDPRDFNI